MESKLNVYNGAAMNCNNPPWKHTPSPALRRFEKDEAALRCNVIKCFQPNVLSHYAQEIETILTPPWTFYVNGMIDILQRDPLIVGLSITQWTQDFHHTLVMVSEQTLAHLIPPEEREQMAWRMAHNAQQGCTTLLLNHARSLTIHPYYLDSPSVRQEHDTRKD